MRLQTKEVVLGLPEKTGKGEIAIFDFYRRYTFIRPLTRVLHNVFVTHSGIVYSLFKLYRESIFDQKGLFKIYFFSALFNLIRRRKTSKKGTYYIIHNPWCPGYFAWLHIAIPKLLNQSLSENAILLLPGQYKNKSFIIDSLKPFQLENIEFYEHNAIVEKLFLLGNPRLGGMFLPDEVLELQNKFIAYGLANDLIRKRDQKLKVYISRSRANTRKVVNEIELKELLLNYGFCVYHMEELNFWEQVSLMYNAEVVLSSHGAGLSNILFMTESSVVIELINNEISIKNFRPSFFRLSKLLKCRYQYVLCATDKKLPASPYSKDIIVDLVEIDDLMRRVSDSLDIDKKGKS